MTTTVRAAAFAVAASCAIAACGGSSSSTGPSSPTAPPADAVAATTITIANGAVSPKNVRVTRGTQVTFINNDSQPHNMTSDPHPDHGDCPEINSVGVINPGQTKRTDNMITNRAVCGFHDHDRFDVAGLQGSITIQ